ncbi:tetratricopeptide repeat protein [Kitasatospora sp. NPDC056651]|uniref:tetratricopeptide repeat protein n=1 Tax=Kitasatospora sp. NPDC056651 TaxID=3345892 RepID=UPI0036B6F05D
MNLIENGIFFGAVVQGREVTVRLPPRITPALSGLPSPTSTFTGRDDVVEDLLRDLAPEQPHSPVLVTAIAGLAGVGKTELVLQVATRALRRPDWFPGGALFVDLLGYDDDRRVAPAQALEGLLRALGIPPEHIPPDLQDRERLYRSVVSCYAEHGQRLLIVLDNACAPWQVTPLLPADGTADTLVTSRHTLAIDARLHDLDVLDVDASTELVRRCLRRARGEGDTRVDDDPGSAARIAELCGRLPLALQICAAILADTPRQPLRAFADSLEATRNRLDRISRENLAVRAAFDLSYRQLSPQQAALFRLLSANPGPDLSTEAAGYLLSVDTDEAEALLQDLARAHLVEPGQAWGRWRLHDLVRIYSDQLGRETADADDRAKARDRLFWHYLHCVSAAATHLRPGPDTELSPHFEHRSEATTWLESERRNLIAMVEASEDSGIAFRVSFTIPDYFEKHRLFEEWLMLCEAGVRSFRRSGDRHSEAMALDNSGLALARLRRYGEALTRHRRAAAVFAELDDRRCGGIAHTNLSSSLNDNGQFDEAVTAGRQALATAREFSDRDLESKALLNIGHGLQGGGRPEEAVRLFTEAENVARAAGDRHNEASALADKAPALEELGRAKEALRALTRAAQLFAEVGDHYRKAGTLINRGVVITRSGGTAKKAVALFAQAVEILVAEEATHDLATARANLSLALASAGRFEGATAEAAKAVEVFRALGDDVTAAALEADLRSLLQETRTSGPPAPRRSSPTRR